MGDGLNDIAIPWLLLTLTGSGLQLSLLLVARFVPVVLFALVAGVLADRFNRRSIMVIADVVRLGLLASLAVADQVWGLVPIHLYVVAFFEAAFSEIFGPAKDALVPKIVPPDRLDAANGMLNGSGQFAYLVAPPIGGVLLGVLGATGIFVADAATFGVSALTTLALRTSGGVTPGPVRRRGVAGAFLADVAEGWRIIRGTPILLTGIALAALMNFLVSPLQVLLPLFVQRVKGGGPELFGGLVAALFAGLLVGALSAPLSVKLAGRGRALIVAVLVLGVAMLAAPWPAPMAAAGAALFVAGVCLATLSVVATSLLQLSAADEVRGRVFALYNFSGQGVRPLSFLLAGALSGLVDLRALIAGLGAITLAVGLAVLNVRELRQAR